MQAVKSEAVTETSDQDDSEPGRTANSGAGGRAERLENGLTPIKDARLTLKSFSWRREARYPTRIPATEIVKAAQAEGRGLTPLETSIVNAAALAGSDKVSERTRTTGIKLILAAERANQLDDHTKAKRPTGSAADASGSSAIPPGSIMIQQNIGTAPNAAINGGSPDVGRSRFLELRDRFRNSGILPVDSDNGSGSDPGRTDPPIESARTD
jgi:hypothetical protein